MKIILVIFLVLLVRGQDDLYRLVMLSQDRGAACLDGSAPAVYVHEGQGQNRNNYLIYFQGGGYCGESTLAKTIQSCYQRSFTHLGSSRKYSPTMNASGMGAVSPLPNQNPLFYGWTKIIGKYCDGHEYLGHRESPIQYKDAKLYFRGSRNVKEIFYYLNQKYDFYNGEKIVIGGGSAGGICAYEWSNFLHENTKKAKVFANPDSGFFITDYKTPIFDAKLQRPLLQLLMNLVFNQAETPQPILKCLQNEVFDIVDCMNVGNFAKYIKTPLFIVQSPYDQYSLQIIVGAKCLSNTQRPYSLQNCNESHRAAIEDYRLQSIKYLKSMKNGRKNVGIWGPACVQHSFEHISESYFGAKYKVKGKSLLQALTEFLNNPEQGPWLLDQMPWPQNKGCNGLVNKKEQRQS